MAARVTPDPVVVEVVSEPARWWEVLGALGPPAVLLAAAVAGLVAWQDTRQRREAERRTAWWMRAEWALDAVSSTQPERRLQGLAVLNHLAASELAGEDEFLLLEAVWANALDPDGGTGATTAATGNADAQADKRPEQQEPPTFRARPDTDARRHRINVLAARLRLRTDRGLGKATPDWVADLAGDPSKQ